MCKVHRYEVNKYDMYVCLLFSFSKKAECDLYACGFDNQECSLYWHPYQNCSAIAQGIPCYRTFSNGICDKACASEECLYDGFDCDEKVINLENFNLGTYLLCGQF